MLLVESDGTQRGSRGRDGGDPARADASPARPRSASSKDEKQRLLFWSGRKAAFPGGRPHLARLLLHRRHDSAQGARARAAADRSAGRSEFGLPCANVFHAGDGNLHPLILFDANKPGEVGEDDRVRRPHPRAVHRGRRHGDRRARRRRRKAQRRCACSSRRTELERFHGVKAAFDAHGLLNPGQGACRRCALRRVRQDARAPRRSSRIPELPRF